MYKNLGANTLPLSDAPEGVELDKKSSTELVLLLARDFLYLRLVFMLWELMTGSKPRGNSKVRKKKAECKDSQSRLDCATHSAQEPVSQRRTSAQREGLSTEPHVGSPRREERATQEEKRGTTSRMMKLNQPPKDLVEEDLLEHAEDLLLYHEVGGLEEEEDRKGGAQLARGS